MVIVEPAIDGPQACWAIILGVTIFLLILFVASIDFYDLSEPFCHYSKTNAKDWDHEACKPVMRLYLYGVWAVATIIFVPLQYLIMSIFKAYHDELKEDGQGYSQLPNEDDTNTA